MCCVFYVVKNFVEKYCYGFFLGFFWGFGNWFDCFNDFCIIDYNVEFIECFYCMIYSSLNIGFFCYIVFDKLGCVFKGGCYFGICFFL